MTTIYQIFLLGSESWENNIRVLLILIMFLGIIWVFFSGVFCVIEEVVKGFKK